MYSAALYGGSNETVQVMRKEHVFVPTLKLSVKDTRILHKHGDHGSVTIVDSWLYAANFLFDSENHD